MIHSDFQKKLSSHIESELNIKISDVETPPQGMTSKVFFITSTDGQEYAVKYGEYALNDVPALELISKEGINIPVPKLFKSFLFEETPVIILERIKYPLLDSIPVEQMAKYIPSMVKNMRVLHTLKSNKPGLLIEPNSQKTWKDMMLAIFNSESIDWNEVANRKSLEKALVINSVEKITCKLNSLDLKLDQYPLLHSDFNQRNLFIDPESDEVTSIIDWEEAMFGDPIYDFARIRMYIWHFNLSNETIDAYYKLMKYTPEEKKLEDLYWLSRVIQYLAWYSEEVNQFNTERIKQHQNFLRNYNWNG